MPQPVRVFISYAHEDDAHRIRLEKALSLMRREGLVESWHDRKLLGGDEWAGQIKDELERAELVLLLVSDDFLASDYCWDVEVKRALERHEAREARVVPIVVRACDWTTAPLGKLQALPQDALAVTSWPNQDEAWKDVSFGLRHVVKLLAGALEDQEAEALPGAGPNPRRYLEALETENAYVELRGMGAQVAERLPLDRVYTRLQVAGGGAGQARPIGKKRGYQIELFDEGRSLGLAEVLAAEPDAVLIGDPGSGKTTFLRFVAQILARAGQDRNGGLVGAHLGIEGEPPFPIFVRLSRFAEFLASHEDSSCPAEAPEHFLRYLDFTLRGQVHRLPETYLRERVEAGGCCLLLDGLDEVPGGLRERTAAIVEKLVVAGRGRNRHLLTCRTRAYEGKTQLATLPAFRLADFEPEQIEEFVRNWCLALFDAPADSAEGPAATEAETYRQSLQGAIDSHPNVAPLTTNPLMLTMLAVVHWNRRRLPEQRAELYAVAVEYLLESRKEQSLAPTPLRREALQALALRMFEDREGVQRSLGRHEAAQAIQPVLVCERPVAEAFLDAESLHSGLLVSREEGAFEFWHLTFQEYLAALELSTVEHYWHHLEPHLYDDRWSEVVLLLAGCLRKNGGLRAARQLLERILAPAETLPERARAVGLCGRILRDLEPYGGDAAAGTVYGERLAQTMAIFEPAGAATIPERLRVEVGEALGQAGDPRFVDPVANRVRIPGGTFWMGAERRKEIAARLDLEARRIEGPVHLVEISPFIIGKYPVTVAEFGAFVDPKHGGYKDPRFWDSRGWAWRESDGITQPTSWQLQLRHPNRPVVFVSWYEADAYCRWISGRLPSEADWEFAARGLEGRKYPWGKAEPTDGHANFARRLAAATPVGIYPYGATPDGVRDLAGNVWEWCSDRFSSYRAGSQTNPAGAASGNQRIVRGGSFLSAQQSLRGAYRFQLHPISRNEGVGFRVVWSPGGGLAAH